MKIETKEKVLQTNHSSSFQEAGSGRPSCKAALDLLEVIEVSYKGDDEKLSLQLHSQPAKCINQHPKELLYP